MKKVGLCFVSIMLFVGVGAFAGYVGPGAPQGITTIPQAKQLHDDTWITLEGYITKSIGDEKYEFRDTTGSTIIIEIDSEAWHRSNLNITANQLVRIHGKVDQHFFGSTTIDDVKYIELAQSPEQTNAITPTQLQQPQKVQQPVTPQGVQTQQGAHVPAPPLH